QRLDQVVQRLCSLGAENEQAADTRIFFRQGNVWHGMLFDLKIKKLPYLHGAGVEGPPRMLEFLVRLDRLQLRALQRPVCTASAWLPRTAGIDVPDRIRAGIILEAQAVVIR